MKPPRTLNVKIFSPGNKTWQRLLIRAPKGAAFSPEAEDYALKNIAERVEHAMPAEAFDVIKIGRGEYNFVHIGKIAAVEVA